MTIGSAPDRTKTFKIKGLMNRLARIVHAARPGIGVQFRRKPYGSSGIRRFLRDVIAIANADVEGSRYIIVGADFDASGKKRLTAVSSNDFCGKPAYRDLVIEFVEPEIRLQYEPVVIDGKRLGVFEIGDCQDQPYMMRIDHSQKLRRGDAYQRVDNTPIKMGRRRLQDMFERQFRDSVSPEQIEIGFPGEIIHKRLEIQTTDLDQMPSAVARVKMKELLDIQSRSKGTGSTTGVIRLAHARLFGCDDPYETWTPAKLMEEMSNIETKHEFDDLHFLFEENAQELQLVVYNQGEEPIREASLSIVLPNHSAFHVANELPRLPRDGEYVERKKDEQSAYPSVRLKNGSVHVSNAVGEIPAGKSANVFRVPLRICVGSDLKGRKLGLQYALFGTNLKKPAKGKLRLIV